MGSVSHNSNDDANKYFIKIDFGVVPVGSIHKRTIDITNDLKKITTFKLKNNNECMYLADSISFEPSKTPRIFPKKKTTFSITFSPKLVQTTLEYFTIYSTNDHIVTDDDEHEESHGEIVQKYTVCVQGSCYGPAVKIFPSEVFICQSGCDKRTIKSVNLVNSSKTPARYHVHYDWDNCPLKCHPSFGIVESRVQIKLELKSRHTGYYYKRLYVLIADHHPVYVDVYAFSSTMTTTVDPFAHFRSPPFESPSKYANTYVDFFRDVAHPLLTEQQPVTVFPNQLHFGYVKIAKTVSFDVRNNSDSEICIKWIQLNDEREFGGGNAFTINPQQFQINGHETKTLECTFRPKTVSNIYFVQLEATILHFGTADRSHANFEEMSPRLGVYVVPLNITLTATGHSFKKPFNGWKPKCKLSTREIVMPPSVPSSEPVFATFFIKKIFQVPTTFELRPPEKSIFSVKPQCGLIHGDYQIIVFQLVKSGSKESLYAERWSIVFDGVDDNSISIDVYASVEFGCVAVGEKNRVHVSAVQVGCEIVVPVPIVNTTRHRIRYCVRGTCDHLRPESGMTPSSSVNSGASYDGEPNAGEDEQEPETIEEWDDILGEDVYDEGGPIHDPEGRFAPETSTTATGGGRVPSFAFDEVVGRLGPNETGRLNLSFRPSTPTSYALRARCYVMCDDFPGVVSVLPVEVSGRGCETRLEITPTNCDFKDTILNTGRTKRFIIENKSCSYADVRIVTTPACSTSCWPMPTCSINPQFFHFTPQQNYLKIDLSFTPTELGFMKFYIKILFDNSEDSNLGHHENTITVCMNVVTCALQITSITNDFIPYFGKFTLNKLFHCTKVNNELSKVRTKNISPLIWNIPVFSEPTIFEFQFHNLSKTPISWALKYNKCIKCETENNNDKKCNGNHKNYGTISNKCVHSKSIQIFPAVNLKMNDFSKLHVELNNIKSDELDLSYTWSFGMNNTTLYNAELLLKSKGFNDGLISFDSKYGTNEHLEFNFIPIFIAHPNPPAQAFWIYNSNNCTDIEYSIVDDLLKPAYPHFRCLNPTGVVKSRTVYPILFVFAPNQLRKFEASVKLVSNNNQRQITLLGQGESYTKTFSSPGPGFSSFLPIQNNRNIFLSTEFIILKPMFTHSNIKCIFCLYNNSDDEIIYEWKKCTIEKIMTADIFPFKGSLKQQKSQVFETTITSYNQPAILTIMLNISYKSVSQNENYTQLIKNYNINKNKLEGVFIINECGNFKPKLNMKLEKPPQEKNLVLNINVRIIEEYRNKWLNNPKTDTMKLNNEHENTILKQKIYHSENLQNILWSVVDKICAKEIENNKLYYYQLRNSKEKINTEISKEAKHFLKVILTELIKDILTDLYPLDTWKN